MKAISALLVVFPLLMTACGPRSESSTNRDPAGSRFKLECSIGRRNLNTFIAQLDEGTLKSIKEKFPILRDINKLSFCRLYAQNVFLSDSSAVSWIYVPSSAERGQFKVMLKEKSDGDWIYVNASAVDNSSDETRTMNKLFDSSKKVFNE